MKYLDMFGNEIKAGDIVAFIKKSKDYGTMFFYCHIKSFEEKDTAKKHKIIANLIPDVNVTWERGTFTKKELKPQYNIDIDRLFKCVKKSSK